MPVRKYRAETSEVSCCLKYVIFGFNVMFWLLGLVILAVGIWAWTEKDTFNNLSRLTNIALDPAFVLILVGTVTFVIGFAGCVGALRENTCLLAAYAIFLGILLLLELTVGVLGFIFKDSIKAQATHGFQVFIKHYREDPDQQNLIDWIQEDWLQCCGIEGPKDWDRNNYFNCSSREVGSREACGVPFSCCKRKPNEIIKNKQCGYDVRKPGYYADGWTNLSPTQPGERNIFERGCLRAGEEWVETNLVPVAGVAVGVAVLQNYDVGKIINEKGCVQAGEEWVEHNLLIIAGTAVGTAFLQISLLYIQNYLPDHVMVKGFFREYSIVPLVVKVMERRETFSHISYPRLMYFDYVKLDFAEHLEVRNRISAILGICFAQNLRADIFAQKAKWH